MAEHDPQKVAAILQDYAETLEVLTINSKPLINDLTMAADRYKPLAPQIIRKIESRLFEVPANQKLPLLYLLDSILKNLRGQYQEVISTKVVAIFCHCFEKLTEPKVRISLYKLRQTWNPFIVKKKLAAIDKHIHALDPNWPVTATDVTAPTSPTIHVNPEFLLTAERGGKVVSTATTSSPPQNSVTVAASQTPSNSVQQASLSKEGTTVSGPATLEQRRKHVLEEQKRKKEQLKAKRTELSTSSAVAGNTDGSLLDPRKCAGSSSSSSSSSVPKSAVVAGKKKGKKSSLSPRKNLSSRSSLSPDYDSKSGARRSKLSPRPRSVSPAPTHPHRAPERHRRHGRGQANSKRRSPAVTGDGEGIEGKGEEGIGDILKSLDVSRLLGSIKQVKQKTESCTNSSSLPREDCATTESDPKLVQPPPQKKPKLDDNKATTPPPVHKDTGGVASTVENDDVILKKSHLNLDDIPMELLPTHQEKIMKQVERQLKSGQLSEEQHTTLVKQLDQLYALQRKKENGREDRGERGDPQQGPSTEEHSPPPPSDAARTDHPPSDSVKSFHSNHLPSSVSVPGSKPHPSVSDTDFRPLSPPLHAPVPPHPHIDRHPHTRSQPPFDRYPPRQFSDYSAGPHGPRPYQSRIPRGRRPFAPHPRPPGGPDSDWYPRGPPDRWREHDRDESPPTAKHPLPPNQGESDPAQLFDKLVELGIIKEEDKEREGEREGSQERGTGPGQPLALQPPPPEAANVQVPFAIPTLTFTVATLKKPYSALVRLMYSGDPCATCGLRFRDRKTADYSRHLDWHYKMNSREKTLQRPSHWFLHPEDWLKFEESMADDETREPLVLEREVEGIEEGGEGEGDREEGQGTSCEVLPGEEAEVCTICAEQFEQFWEEELEEWHFREALREEGKLYHTYCYQDAKESGALSVSVLQPSPMDIEHKPLAIA